MEIGPTPTRCRVTSECPTIFCKGWCCELIKQARRLEAGGFRAQIPDDMMELVAMEMCDEVRYSQTKGR